MEETLHKTKVDIIITLGERITTIKDYQRERTANIEANMNTVKK